MPTYVVTEIEIHDKDRYETYKAMVQPALDAYDGRFIVRGGQTETLEGGWSPQRMVILEFPSAERAREWWGSKEYADAKALRQATSTTRMVIVEGV